MKHRKVAIEEDESGRLTAEVAYGDAKKKLHVTALMGMFLAQLKKRLGEETRDAEEVIISLVLPPNHTKDPSVERAYREASTIAGIVADKLFVADLNKEDEAEVKALKLSLYLNLASCYIKMENWEQVLRNCTDALSIDANSVKALFRRASYFEHKKDWDKALTDLKQCAKLNGATEDKAITLATERIKKHIQNEKNKEKKTWGKLFG